MQSCIPVLIMTGILFLTSIPFVSGDETDYSSQEYENTTSEWYFSQMGNVSVSYPPGWQVLPQGTKDNQWYCLTPDDGITALDIGEAPSDVPAIDQARDICRFVSLQGAEILQNVSELKLPDTHAVTFEYQMYGTEPGICRTIIIDKGKRIVILFYHAEQRRTYDRNYDMMMNIVRTIR